MISSPKDVKVNQERKDDIRGWPNVQHINMYDHLMLSRACDGEEMKKYKSMDSYDYSKRGSLEKEYINSPSEIKKKGAPVTKN